MMTNHPAEVLGRPVPYPKKAPLVYLIDDDKSYRYLYELVFPEAGVDVKTFESGEAALSAMPELPPPDYLFVDFRLNRMNGEQFVSELSRQMPDLHRTSRLVGWSSLQKGGPLTQSFEAAVDTYVQKPHDLDQLVHVVKRLVGM